RLPLSPWRRHPTVHHGFEGLSLFGGPPPPPRHDYRRHDGGPAHQRPSIVRDSLPSRPAHILPLLCGSLRLVLRMPRLAEANRTCVIRSPAARPGRPFLTPYALP